MRSSGLGPIPLLSLSLEAPSTASKTLVPSGLPTEQNFTA